MIHGFTNLQIRVDEFVHSLRHGQGGATMVEYALLVVLIAIALVTAVTLLSGGIGTLFSRAGSAVTNA